MSEQNDGRITATEVRERRAKPEVELENSNSPTPADVHQLIEGYPISDDIEVLASLMEAIS